LRTNIKNKTRANAVLTKLLETFVVASVNWNKDIDANSESSNNLIYLSLSTNYKFICESENQRILEHRPLSDNNKENIIYNKILLATDQISGMTDRHALSIYKMLTAN
jgi:dGTP triphosphohydrolase